MNNRTVVEIVGLTSVIGSLIFVGVEISQNTAAVRGATQQEVSYQISEMYRIMAENERIAFLMGKVLSGRSSSELNETDLMRVGAFIRMGYRRIENIYLQYRNGLLTESAFTRIGLNSYRTTIAREIWEDRKEDFDPEFAEFFEKLRDAEE